jgi:hypothetical protein
MASIIFYYGTAATIKTAVARLKISRMWARDIAQMMNK